MDNSLQQPASRLSTDAPNDSEMEHESQSSLSLNLNDDSLAANESSSNQSSNLVRSNLLFNLPKNVNNATRGPGDSNPSLDLNSFLFDQTARNNRFQNIQPRLTTNSWKCVHCQYQTSDAQLFAIHYQSCASKPNNQQLDPKPYKCNLCNYSAKSQSAFNYHQKTHTGEKPFACHYCDYRTILKRSLVVHLRTHTQEKPYACQHCPYRANQKSNLDTHMIRHLTKNNN